MFLTKNRVYSSTIYQTVPSIGCLGASWAWPVSRGTVQAKAGLGGVGCLAEKKNGVEKRHQKTVKNLPGELRRRRRIFPQRCIKCTISLPSDVQMYSNKLCCVVLIMGCVPKVIWKCFERFRETEKNLGIIFESNTAL